MKQTLLLGTGHGVVRREEIRNQHPIEIVQNPPNNLSLSRIGIHECDLTQARKHPDVTGFSFDASASFVNLYEAALSKLFEYHAPRRLVARGRGRFQGGD